MDDVMSMPTGRLMENYRSLVSQTALAVGLDKAKLSGKADLYEQEILRRMAW